MFAAAGIVVTETRTPISAPDFEDVSASAPAIPATKATMNEKRSGREMKSVSGWSVTVKPAGWRSVARRARVKRNAAVIPTGNPTASARSERRATSRRRWTIATRQPGERPVLGADDHRPDDQDRRVEEDADRGDQAGERHEGEEARVELGVLGGPRLDLLPDHGVARAGRRRRSRPSPRRSRSRSRCARSRSSPRCRRRARAGPRRSRSRPRAATSHRITSPSGLRAARSR